MNIGLWKEAVLPLGLNGLACKLEGADKMLNDIL